jgi:hypothetical protein
MLSSFWLRMDFSIESNRDNKFLKVDIIKFALYVEVYIIFELIGQSELNSSLLL